MTRTTIALASLLPAFVICSCAKGLHSYFPLDKQCVWKYTVQNSFDTFPDTLRVVGRVPVGPVMGYRLQAGMGTSCFAWYGDTLLASEIAGQRFDPPVPLIAPRPLRWSGHWESAGRRKAATAHLKCEPAKTDFAGRKVDAMLATLTVDTAGKSVELTTWYVEGTGIFRQEQRSQGRRERRIDYLSGP